MCEMDYLSSVTLQGKPYTLLIITLKIFLILIEFLDEQKINGAFMAWANRRAWRVTSATYTFKHVQHCYWVC